MKSEINLLSILPLKKKGNKIFSKNPWLKIILGFLILFLTGYGILTILNQNCLEEIKRVEEVIRNQSNFRIPYENLTTENELLAHHEKVSGVLKQNNEVPVNVLIGVQEVLPLGMNLVDYQFKGNDLTLAGNTQNQEDILEFRENLMALGFFKNVTIEKTVKKQVIEVAKIDVSGNSIKENIWNFIVEIEGWESTNHE